MTDRQTSHEGYPGEVRPGGPTAARTLEGLTVRKASVSATDNNVYLLTCQATASQLLVDAADDAPRIARLVHEGSGTLDQIVTTHRHWDHHRALAEVVASTGASTAAGEADADALPVIPDRRLVHGDRIALGALRLDVVHLRGHTPGSVALAWTGPDGWTHVFTGDSLFPGGPGRTTNPRDFTSLMDDLEARVFGVFPDSTHIYPGHGKDTTLGVERPHLAEWRERGW